MFIRNVEKELASITLVRDRVTSRVENCDFNENISPKGETISVDSSVMYNRDSNLTNNQGVQPAPVELSITTERSVIENIQVCISRNTTYFFTLFGLKMVAATICNPLEQKYINFNYRQRQQYLNS